MNDRGPLSRFYSSSSLRLHYLVWGDEQGAPLLLVHGGRDHARSWDALAAALSASYTVYVPDLRGHGDSDWAPASQYAIPDFVADLSSLIDLLARERERKEQVTLIGHSRGGGIVLRYAGTFPEQVLRVVSIDGLGRHIRWQEPAPRRLRRWIQRRQEVDTWHIRPYGTLDAAINRLREANPRLDPDLTRHLAIHGTRPEASGGFTWKFDPRTHYHPAYDFDDDELRQFFAQIHAPVLLIRGDESRLGDRQQEEWVTTFPNARSVIVPGAGHWVQHDRPEELLTIIQGFLAAGAAQLG